MPEHGMPVARVARFTLRPGADAAFDALVAETAAGIRESEPGTLAYACHQVETKPTERIFYELYAGQAALDAHEASDHIRRFVAEHDALVESTEVDVLRLDDGKTPLSLQTAAVVRRTEDQLRASEERAHLLRAILKGINEIDAVTALIRESESAAAALPGLMNLLGVDDVQARAVLDMQMRKLAVMQRQQVADEFAEVTARIANYESILASPDRQRDIASVELTETDARSAELVEEDSAPGRPSPWSGD